MIFDEETRNQFLRLKSSLLETGGGTTSTSTVYFPPISASAHNVISWLHKYTLSDTCTIDMGNNRSLQLLQLDKVQDIHECTILYQGGQLRHGDDSIHLECLICYEITPVTMWKCRIEIQNWLAETEWYTEQLRLEFYSIFVSEDSLSQMPRKPESGEGMDGWFAYKTSMDAAGYKYTFKQMALDSNWTEGHLKNQYAVWKAEFGIGD